MAENTRANVFSLQASISIDTTNFEKKIAKIKESGLILQQTMEKGIKSVKALQEFLNKFDTTKFQKSVKGMGEGLDGLGDSAKEGKEKIDDVGDSAEDTAKKSKTAFGTLKDSVKATFSEMGEHFKLTGDSLQKSVSQTAASFSKITSAAQTVVGAVEKVGEVAVKSFQIAVKAGEEFSKAIVGIVEKSNDIENKISLAFAGAGAAIGTYAFSVGKDFESSMANVIAIMGKTKESVTENGTNIYEMLKSAAEEAGATTMFTATESADALSYLALAGYDAYKAVNALPTVLNIAKAGGMDLAYASDLVTDAMNAMGLEATDENLTHFGDVLAKTASSSNTSVSQLGEALLVCAGQAKIANVDLEDTATMLGILADAGYKGSEGGTMFRNLLKNMYTPTAAAKESMKKLGLNRFDEATGEIKNVQVFLSEIVSTINNLESDEDKLQAYADLFDTRVIAGASIALEKCSDRYDELRGKINECDGAMEQMGKTMSDTLSGDMQSMTSRFQSVGLEIYDYIEEPMRGAVQEVSTYLSELQTTIDEHGLSVGAFHIGDMVDEALEKSTPSITGYMDEAELIIRRFIQGFSNNIPNISENIGEIIQKYGETRDKIFNAIVDTFGKSENSKSLVNIGATILDTMLTTAENVTGKLADKSPTFIKQIAVSLSKNKDSWTKSITAIIKNISDLVSKSAPALVEIGGTLLGAIVQGMATTTTEITKILPEITDSLTKLFSDKEFSQSLQLSFKQIIGDIGDIVVTLVKFLAEPENIDFTTELLENILTEIMKTLTEIEPLIKPEIKTIAEEITKFVLEEVTPFMATVNAIGFKIGLAFIGGIFSGIANAKIGNFPSLAEIFGSRGKNYVEQLGKIDYSVYDSPLVRPSQDIDFSGPMQFNPTETQIYPQQIEETKETKYPTQIGTNNGGFMQGLNTSMANLVSQMDFSWAAEIGSKFVMNVGTGISTAWDKIKENIKGIFSSLDLSEKVEDAKEWGSKFIANFSSNAIHKWDNWKDSVAKIFDFFDLSGLAEDAKTWGADMIHNFALGINSMEDEVGTAIGGVAGLVANFLHHSTPDKGPLKDDDVWGEHFIQNFIDGIKIKSDALESAVQYIATGIKETFNEPVSIETNIATKGVLQDFESPDMKLDENMLAFPDISGLIANDIKEKKQSIFDEIKDIITDIKNTFSKPFSVETDVNAKGILHNFETPDITNLFTDGIRSNIDRIYSEVNKITDNMKSNFADISVPQPLNYKYISESIQPRTVPERSTPDVTIQNININMEGMNIESDYDVDRMSDRMIEKLSERLQMLGIFNDRARGGAAW